MLGVDDSLPWFTGGFAGERGPRRFTSCQDCPACSALATHWLDQPKTSTYEEWARYFCDLRNWAENPGQEIVAFGGGVVRTIGGSPKPKVPADESEFEVMRICRACGHRWGNV